jgi:hypothetical protein
MHAYKTKHHGVGGTARLTRFIKQRKTPNFHVLCRFTKEAVVVTAPSKVKGGSELQLPSMNALTNKTSSQVRFLSNFSSDK